MNKPSQKLSGYASGRYWRERMDLMYYQYIDYILRAVANKAQSLIDVGSGNCPYLEWFDWIPERVSVDIRVPYRSDTVKGIQGDILTMDPGQKFDVCTCFQVLEHVPDAGPFAKRLLEFSDLCIVSVPHLWPAGRTPGHVHDPVDYEKLTGWFGREANYKIVVKEPFRERGGERLIAIFDRDPKRRFTRKLIEDRIRRDV